MSCPMNSVYEVLREPDKDSHTFTKKKNIESWVDISDPHYENQESSDDSNSNFETYNSGYKRSYSEVVRGNQNTYEPKLIDSINGRDFYSFKGLLFGNWTEKLNPIKIIGKIDWNIRRYLTPRLISKEHDRKDSGNPDNDKYGVLYVFNPAEAELFKL